MKILIVDDDILMLDSIAHNLKAEGYEVSLAEDSLKALSIIENEKIDLILSDIMMPDISGLEFLSMLKEFYFDKIPLIFISAMDDKLGIKSSSINLGAKEFISKPIDFVALSLCVKKYAKK